MIYKNKEALGDKKSKSATKSEKNAFRSYDNSTKSINQTKREVIEKNKKKQNLQIKNRGTSEK